MLRTGRHVWGDQAVSQELIALAREVTSRPAPAPSAAEASAHRSRPYNLMRKYVDVRQRDAVAGGLLAMQAIVAATEAYFSLNRIWKVGERERLDVIERTNPVAAEALRRVIEVCPAALSERPELLESAITSLVGEPFGAEEEDWLEFAR